MQKQYSILAVVNKFGDFAVWKMTHDTAGNTVVLEKGDYVIAQEIMTPIIGYEISAAKLYVFKPVVDNNDCLEGLTHESFMFCVDTPTQVAAADLLSVDDNTIYRALAVAIEIRENAGPSPASFDFKQAIATDAIASLEAFDAMADSNDLMVAKIIAVESVRKLGGIDDVDLIRALNENGLPDNHPTVQAALTAIKLTRKELLRKVSAGFQV